MTLGLQQFTKPEHSALLAAGHQSIHSLLAGCLDVLPEFSSLYVHSPFCFHKCHYCDFYSIVDRHGRMQAFTEALVRDASHMARYSSLPIKTVFVGGGTPTLMPVSSWQVFFTALRSACTLAEDCEFTVEANPETVTQELAQCLASNGVNRVSVGVQSFHTAHLKTLERHHDPANVERAIARVRSAGIENINLDLIFAIPGQAADEWLCDLQQALECDPEHLSCYNLTYEPNTLLTARRNAGDVQPVDQDVESRMYEDTCELLVSHGFEHYEISNWCRTGRECRHNFVYWRNENWWALGPGASGHMQGLRWKNAPRLDAYIDSTSPPIVDVELPDPTRTVSDMLMMGLRTSEGVNWTLLQRHVLRDGRWSQRESIIHANIERGHMEHMNGYLRLTSRGMRIADSILIDLI